VLLKHQIITIILLHFSLRQVENKETAYSQISTITAKLDATGTAQARPRRQLPCRTTPPQLGQPQSHQTLLLQRGYGGYGFGRFRHRPGRKTPPTPGSEHAVIARPNSTPPNVAPPTWVWTLPAPPRPEHAANACARPRRHATKCCSSNVGQPLFLLRFSNFPSLFLTSSLSKQKSHQW
jgi:hypothetical protein